MATQCERGVVNRKQFITYGGLSGIYAGLELTMKTPERFSFYDLDFNPEASLTNLSMLPSTVYDHTNYENILFPVNIKTTYDPDSRGYVQEDSAKSEFARYGGGLKEAVGRGQKVFLVIDFPGETSDINLEQWKRYVAEIFVRCKPTHAVIGNELNTPAHARWFENPKNSAVYFSAAAQEVNRTSPQTKIILPGEACYQHGEFLTGMLGAISSSDPDILKRVSGLCFHCYGKAGLIPERMGLYQQIARQFNLPGKLFLTELGKEEGIIISSRDLRATLIQEMAVSLALKDSGSFDSVFWHTAFQPTHEDPYQHSLTCYIKDTQIIKAKEAFNVFWKISKLLYKNVTLRIADGITFVRGETSEGQSVLVVWNNLPYGDEQDFRDASFEDAGDKILFTTQSPYCEGDPLIYINDKKYHGILPI